MMVNRVRSRNYGSTPFGLWGKEIEAFHYFARKVERAFEKKAIAL